MKNITPFLWFNTEAEEAAIFYTSIFKNSKIGNMSRFGEGGPGPKGTVMVAPFTINGQDFLAMNGGTLFKFNEAISFAINCETQEEIDAYWEKLSAGGNKSRCGWLKDKFGLSWQVVPYNMGQLISGNGDTQKAQRVMAAMMKMDKIIIKDLEEA